MNRAHRSLWVLTAVTVLAAGLLAQSLAATAGLGADILLAGSALLLAISGALLIRVLRHLTQHRMPGPDTRPARTPARAPHGRAPAVIVVPPSEE